VTYKDLFYFTGHCLALDDHPQFREHFIELFQAEGADLENFVQLCSNHLIIPAIYLKLKAHDILAYLPKDFIQAFKEIYDLNYERNLQILKQIEDITTVLNKENIQPVFLKGSANLLDGVYSDVGERMIGDIDFLVSESDYLRTAAILEDQGYQHGEIYNFDFKNHKHYPTLCKEGEVAAIEIHWLPVRREHAHQFNSKVVLSDKKIIEGKPELYVPSDNHKLIHTFIHSQLEDRGHAYKQSSFRGFYDLYLLSKRVDVSSLVDHSGYKKKAISWLVFGQLVFGLQGRFYTTETIGARIFCWKYDRSLSFVKTHNFYNIFKRHTLTFFKAFYSSDQRQRIYRKLKRMVP